MKSWFALAFLCFCLGDYFGISEPQKFQYIFYGLGLSFIFLFISFLKVWEGKSKATIGLLIMALCGALVGANAERNYRETSLTRYLENNVTVSGTIDLLSIKANDKGIGFLLDIETIELNNVRQSVNAKIRVWSNRIKYSDVLKGKAIVKGELQELYSFANPGGFDSDNWNKVQNIKGRIIAKETIKFSYDDAYSAEFFRYAVGLRDKIKHTNQGECGALLCGLVLGGYDGISDLTEEAFSATGLAHILSVSGTHMAIIAGFLSAFVRRKYKRYLVVGLAAYALLCGGAAAVWRSFLISAVVLFGNDRFYKAQSGNILCFSGMVLLVYNPFWLTEPGFQLSFSATAGLVYCYPLLKDRLVKYFNNFLAEGLAITLAAQILTLPFLLHHFHYISVLSFVANILFVPILEIIVIIGLVGVLIPLEISAYILRFAGFLTDVNIMFISALAEFNRMNLVIAPNSIAFYLGYYALVGMMLSDEFTLERKKQVIVMVLLILLLTTIWQKCFEERTFSIHFMDVGQGDAALVQTPAGTNILVDCGGLNGDFDTGARIVVPYLRYLGVDSVDLLALSHGHHDHAGGAAGVARLAPIKNLLLPYGDSSDDLKELLKTNIYAEKFYAQTGSKYRINDCLIEIVYAGISSDGNENSVIMRLSTDFGSVLFTGDADDAMELVVASQDIKGDVLKVSHHGSQYASCDAFIGSVAPEFAVISVGKNNRYGHPAPESIARLRACGAEVLRTDLLGAVKLTFDESGRQWYSYRYHQEFF